MSPHQNHGYTSPATITLLFQYRRTRL
jgi:hypothetical protein